MEGDGNFMTHYNDHMEDDSVPSIRILELLKHVVFFDASKSYISDSCGKSKGHISCKSNLFG